MVSNGLSGGRALSQPVPLPPPSEGPPQQSIPGWPLGLAPGQLRVRSSRSLRVHHSWLEMQAGVFFLAASALVGDD